MPGSELAVTVGIAQGVGFSILVKAIYQSRSFTTALKSGFMCAAKITCPNYLNTYFKMSTMATPISDLASRKHANNFSSLTMWSSAAPVAITKLSMYVITIICSADAFACWKVADAVYMLKGTLLHSTKLRPHGETVFTLVPRPDQWLFGFFLSID